MEKLDTTKFKTKKELFDFLVKNRDMLITQKKADIKHADGVPYVDTDVSVEIVKKNDVANGNDDEINVKAVINTTNILDSHGDVHINGIWNKSLKENTMIMHLQEHKMAFDKIISDGDDLQVSAKMYDWQTLGFNFKGQTQVLLFESSVKAERNQYMFEQYKKDRVNNHSVGMQYVKMVLAINDDEYGAEFEAWEKYFPMIVNGNAAEEKGYFWAIKEAKVIEGSAVPLGSNFATPTISVKDNLLTMISTSLNEPSPTLDKADNMNIFFNNLNF